jgi:hypothetical protein
VFPRIFVLIGGRALWSGGDPRWRSLGLAVGRCDFQGGRDPPRAQSYGQAFARD